MTFVSYAQNFEDVLLWRALGHIRDGFYIDVGAWHPDTDSVTRAFYDRGWRGINIEPGAENAMRLRAARQRDLTLAIAAGDAPGQATLYTVPGTGLSSLAGELAGGYAASGLTVQPVTVEVQTLREICLAHAPAEIHFLKIDVEGSERAVLAGCDFAAFRPWIVLVEATAPMSTLPAQAEWEPILLAADYCFIWFDGLNRFYAAAERYQQIAQHFRTPANVFDDFVRAADTEWARRIHQAETAARSLCEQALGAERRAVQATSAAEHLRLQSLAHGVELEQHRVMLVQQRAGHAEESRHLHATIAHLEATLREANGWVGAMRASTSWRLTAPMRRVMVGFRRTRAGDDAPGSPDVPLVAPSAKAGPVADVAAPHSSPRPRVPAFASAPARQGRRAVHQFHSGSATGDAITNAMLLIRRILRDLGYHSDIFVEHLDPLLAEELRPIDELPTHAGYVLLLHHSIGYDAMDRVTASAAPKVLIYHNITPPEHLSTTPILQRYAELGRRQLASLAPKVVAALADSEFNASELRAQGFDPVQACTLLFDVDVLTRRAAARPSAAALRPFTILFVGRINESKAQADLIDAYAAFRVAVGGPARLVLVGRTDGANHAYMRRIEERIGEAGLRNEVILTGLVSDEQLQDWYRAADLYVSLSLHEGFGVPLIEAMAHGIPVLAWPCGAIPYTLGEAGELLEHRAPAHVAARMLALAHDEPRREAARQRQHRTLQRFRLDRQVPLLLNALALAGAPPPTPSEVRRELAAHARFTIAGHVNKSYSLAAINRELALAIEAERPNTVRLLPVEGEPTADLSEVPEHQRDAIAVLAARNKPATGPAFVVSQHYPVWVPPDPGDGALALFFWEESIIPRETVAVLNLHFRAVLAPSGFVAKVLVDSGVSVPVRVIGHAPDLAPWRALRTARLTQPKGDPYFTFLHVSSGFPRKGVDVLLAAFGRAFRREHPVRLVIKCFPNPHNDAASQLAEFRARDPQMAEIILIDRDIDHPALIELYAASDAVVLPTRGEGFNLPAAEAMAAGIPLIVTGYGGHLDFCTAANVRLVKHRMARSGSHLASVHGVWAEPDVEDLAAAMRETAAIRDSGGRAAAAWAARTHRAMADINMATARETLVNRLAEAAIDALLTPPRAPLRLAWVSTWDVRCGIAEYSRFLLDRLPRSPGACTIFTDERIPEKVADEADPWTVQSAWRLGDPLSMTELATALAGADPDIVVVQHQPGLFGWGALARLLLSRSLRNRAVVVTLHNTRHLAEVPPDERELAIAALSAIARVLVHTVADLNFLAPLGLERNVTLLPHGAPPPLDARLARPLGHADAPLIGSYGFFLPGKGIPQLIEAVGALRARWPAARLRLVNAEYDSPDSVAEIALCRQIVERHGLAACVEFVTDFLSPDRSGALLAACDLVVLPYQASKEASSASVRTALGAGVPVAVSPLPLFDETDGATIRLLGISSDAIGADLDRVLSDQELRLRVQRAARGWLADRDWRLVAERLHGMLMGLAANPASR